MNMQRVSTSVVAIMALVLSTACGSQDDDAVGDATMVQIADAHGSALTLKVHDTQTSAAGSYASVSLGDSLARA